MSKSKHSHIIQGKRQWNDNALDFFSIQLKDIKNNVPDFEDTVFLEAAKNGIWETIRNDWKVHAHRN